MLGSPGIYMVYRRFPKVDGGPEDRQLLGKFVIFGTELRVLEDHEGLVEDVFPSGPLSGLILKRIAQMKDSPYFSVIKQEDIEQGMHEDEIPTIELNPEPWPKE